MFSNFAYNFNILSSINRKNCRAICHLTTKIQGSKALIPFFSKAEKSSLEHYDIRRQIFIYKRLWFDRMEISLVFFYHFQASKIVLFPPFLTFTTLLLSSADGKIDDIFLFFRENTLPFHANCLLRRQFP